MNVPGNRPMGTRYPHWSLWQGEHQKESTQVPLLDWYRCTRTRPVAPRIRMANWEPRPATHVDRTRCRRAERRKGEQVARADSEGVAPGLARHGDGHTWKQIGEAGWRVQRQIDARQDVPRADPIAIAVHEHPEGNTGLILVKPEGHVRRPHDRVRSGHGHSRRQVSRSRRGPRAVDSCQRGWNRDGGEDGDERRDKQKFDKGVALTGSDHHDGPRSPDISATPGGRYSVRTAARSVVGGVRVTSVFSLRKLTSPMPRTFISSSTFLKPLFCCR